MTTALADPAKMISKGAPHVIHNDEELEEYTNALFRLTALENPSGAEQEAIELLTLLIERYEETSYPNSQGRCGFCGPLSSGTSGPHTARPYSGIRIGECSLHVPGGAAEAHTGASTKIE